jgi:hypothetical protein
MLIEEEVLKENTDAVLAELGGDMCSVNSLNVPVVDVMKAFMHNTEEPVPVGTMPDEPPAGSFTNHPSIVNLFQVLPQLNKNSY